MANVFTRMGNWVKKQQHAYRIQRAIAARDTFIVEAMRGHERLAAGIEATPGLTQLQKEEQRVQALHNYYVAQGRLSEYQAHVQQIQRVTAQAEPDILNPNNTSLGARLGRLFSGRSSTAARQQAAANYTRFTSEYAVPNRYWERLQQIRTDRLLNSRRALDAAIHHPESYEKRKLAFLEAVAVDQREKYNSTTDRERQNYEAMTTEQKQALPKQEKLRLGATLPPDTFTGEWEQTVRKQYPFERQLQAFMEPGAENAAYNERVLRTFCDLDSEGHSQDQDFAKQVINNALDKFRNFDIARINLLNPEENHEVYAELENLYTINHAILDVTKEQGGILSETSYREIFQDQQSAWDMKDKMHYVMCASAVTRGALLANVDYDPRYAFNRELNPQLREPGNVSAARGALREKAAKYDAQRTGENFLNGARDFNDFVARRQNNPQRNYHVDRRFNARPEADVQAEARHLRNVGMEGNVVEEAAVPLATEENVLAHAQEAAAQEPERVEIALSELTGPPVAVAAERLEQPSRQMNGPQI